MEEYGLVWEKREEELESVLKEKRVVLREREDLYIKGGMWSPEHRIIEGDNLASMTHLKDKGERVDVIFCDPPYNTMTSLSYGDSRVNKGDKYRHSEWLNFMEKRLKLSRELLKEDGVIFITIDDRMMNYLKILMDGIYGEENFICNFIWKKRMSPSYQTTNNLSTMHEYILCYGKNKNKVKFKTGGVSEKTIRENYKNKDERGVYALKSVVMEGIRKSKKYEVVSPNGHVFRRSFRYSKKTFEILDSEGRIEWFQDDGKKLPAKKNYLHEVKGAPVMSILNSEDVGFTFSGTVELDNILGESGKFSYPKPSKLVKYLVGRLDYKRDLTVLDIFAGSGSTGHAILDINNEDEYINRFILLNIDEGADGEGNICEDITYKRLKNLLTGYMNLSGKYIKKRTGKLRYYVVDLEDRTEIGKD